MKLKLFEVDRLYGTIIGISKEVPLTRKGTAIAFRLARISKMITPDIEAYIQTRTAIMTRYKDEHGTTHEDGSYELPPAIAAAQNAELVELGSTVTDLDIPESAMVKFSDICTNYHLDVDKYMALLPIIIDDSDSFDADSLDVIPGSGNDDTTE